MLNKYVSDYRLGLLAPVAQNLGRYALELRAEEVVGDEVYIIVILQRLLNEELLIFGLLVEHEEDIRLRSEQHEVGRNVSQWYKFYVACALKSALVVVLVVRQRAMVDLIALGVAVVSLIAEEELEWLRAQLGSGSIGTTPVELLDDVFGVVLGDRISTLYEVAESCRDEHLLQLVGSGSILVEDGLETVEPLRSLGEVCGIVLSGEGVHEHILAKFLGKVCADLNDDRHVLQAVALSNVRAPNALVDGLGSIPATTLPKKVWKTRGVISTAASSYFVFW